MAFELVAASRDGVRVRVRNKDTFVSTADLRLRWRLVLDGSPLALPRPKPGADGYCAVGDLDVPAQVGCAGRPPSCLAWVLGIFRLGLNKVVSKNLNPKPKTPYPMQSGNVDHGLQTGRGQAFRPA